LVYISFKRNKLYIKKKYKTIPHHFAIRKKYKLYKRIHICKNYKVYTNPFYMKKIK